MAERAQQEQIQASREAAAFFQLFDKSSLYSAIPQRETGWLLGEQTQEMEELTPHVPVRGFSLPHDEEKGYVIFIPKAANATPLRLQELNRIVWELVVGVYVFNAIPSVSLRPNHDGSSACVMPSAYHDTLVGTALFEVDYFIKSLLHGTTIPQQSQREAINESWKKTPPNAMRQKFKELGLQYMIDDPELGHDLYEPKKKPFIRHPPKYVDSELAQSELTPQLTTGEEFDRQASHVSRDVFLRYLDNVSIGLQFSQNSFQQDNSVCVLDTAFHVVSRVVSLTTDHESDLHRHLHCYLQRQHQFVTENLKKKREIAHYLDLLCFTSFMTQFLVTLKQQKKIVSFAGQRDIKSGKTLHTSRDVPPVLPSETSQWSPFTAQDSYSSMHGEIQFHIPEQVARPPGIEFKKSYESLKDSGSMAKHKELITCQVSDKTYYVFQVSIEDYYLKSPKLPRWVHCMISELKSQCARLPSLNPRIQELLKKSYGSREATNMQTVPVQLLASIKKGLFPLVALLLKRCTKTHLGKLDDTGLGLVHYAAANCHTEVLALLLHTGCSVDQCCSTTGLEATQPLHLAAGSGSLDTVSCLLHYGANILALDSSGWAAIHYAAFHNYHTIVRHICTVERQCINLKTNDCTGSTPLLLATRNGGFDTVQCLIELGAYVTASDGSNHGIIQLAALYHHIHILKYLIDLEQTDVVVFDQLSAMLVAEPGSGYPEAAARSLDPLTQWRPVEHATALFRNNAIPSLVELLRRKSDEKLQHLAVQVLANISSDMDVRRTLVEVSAVPALVALISSASERVQASTCIVFCDLGMSPNVQTAIVQAVAVPQLVKLLASEADDVQLYSTACLGILAYDNSSNQTSIAAASAIPALKPLLASDLSCIQACAAHTVQALVAENRSCQLGALSTDLLTPLVYLLRSKEVSVHTAAALAIEAIAENCQEAQQELLGNSTCVGLLKRLLRMRDSQVKVAGGRALWAIAGHLISNQRLIATYIGLNLLISMLTIHNEKLDYVCSEALGALATELGDNQRKIMEVGGVKPLVETLTLPTSQRVYLSVINTLSKLIVRPALRPNKLLQKEVAASRGITVLASLVTSQQSTELVCVSAACTLAMLVLENSDNMKFLLTDTDFFLLQIFDFFSSADPTVQIQAGQCLATLAFNNPTQLANLKQHGSIDFNFYLPFLASADEYFKCCAGFQLVVLSKMLTGIRNAEAAVKGIRVLVDLLPSEVEATQVLSASFIACLAHSSPGIPDTIVMAGALDYLISNLMSGSGPVIENCCVALGYFTIHPMAARLIRGTFRDQPEKFDIFREYASSIVVSKEFLSDWQYTEKSGLPVLSLESRGGPPASEGWRIPRRRSSRSRDGYGRMPQQASLGVPSTVTQGTKSHSTLHRVSFVDTTATETAALPHSCLQATGPPESNLPSARGLLMARKTQLERKKVCDHDGLAKAVPIQKKSVEGAQSQSSPHR